MRVEQDEIDLTTAFATGYAELNLGIPVEYPTSEIAPKTDDPYQGFLIRFKIARIPDSRLIARDGSTRHYRNYGSVLLQVVGPRGEGPGKLDRVADMLGEIFRSKRFDGILCQSPSTDSLKESGATASVTVSVPYTSDFKI